MTSHTAQADWARRYGRALALHGRTGSAASLRAALGLGRQAVALDLETLDVARIHELQQPGRPVHTERHTLFFNTAIRPIEMTHLAARKSDLDARRLTETLRQRTAESSASNRHLRQGIARRRSAETALRASGKRRAALLRTARRLQEKLRAQTRAMLAAQEDERLKTSRHLQDEITQILVAIHMRLLSLKNATKANTARLQKDIVGTQRLVGQSVRTIRRLDYGYGGKRET